jgi:hypothetical protein
MLTLREQMLLLREHILLVLEHILWLREHILLAREHCRMLMSAGLRNGRALLLLNRSLLILYEVSLH